MPQVQRLAPQPRSVLRSLPRALPLPLPAPVTGAVRWTAGAAVTWGRNRARSWGEASQEHARRNAMVAATRLARHRVEVAEVELFVAERAAGSTRRAVNG